MKVVVQSRSGLARGVLGAVLAVGIWSAPFEAARGEAPIPVAPTSWVTDNAGTLSPAARGEMERRLGAYARTTGHQVLVYIGRTTGGIPIEDWSARAFDRWRVGRHGIDDGVVLFLFTDDRRIRIEVGYGLEALLPDVRAGRIIAEEITPRMRAGDADGAVRAGVDRIVSALGGTGPAEQKKPEEVPWPVVIPLGILLLILLGVAVTHPRMALWVLLNIGARAGRSGNGTWGGGGRGGGGFSGGGGRSGGGGASGSW